MNSAGPAPIKVMLPVSMPLPETTYPDRNHCEYAIGVGEPQVNYPLAVPGIKHMEPGTPAKVAQSGKSSGIKATNSCPLPRKLRFNLPTRDEPAHFDLDDEPELLVGRVQSLSTP